MFAASGAGPPDWARRVAQLTPHLVDGGGYFIAAARDHLRAALAAARGGDTAEAARLLGQAEALTPPLTPVPEREADLVAVIGQHAARYGYTDDPAGYMARAMPPLLDASDREWDWVRSYISAHPEVREHRAQDEPAAQASRPMTAGSRPPADPVRPRPRWKAATSSRRSPCWTRPSCCTPITGSPVSAAREQVRSAIDQNRPGHSQDQDSPATAIGRPGTGDAAEAAPPRTPQLRIHPAAAAPGRKPQHAQARPGSGRMLRAPPARRTRDSSAAPGQAVRVGKPSSPAAGQHAPDDTEAAPVRPGRLLRDPHAPGHPWESTSA